jgi:hypothetical protein
VADCGARAAAGDVSGGMALRPPIKRSSSPFFRQGVTDLGFVEGRNVALAHRSAEFHPERFPASPTTSRNYGYQSLRPSAVCPPCSCLRQVSRIRIGLNLNSAAAGNFRIGSEFYWVPPNDAWTGRRPHNCKKRARAAGNLPTSNRKTRLSYEIAKVCLAVCSASKKVSTLSFRPPW